MKKLLILIVSFGMILLFIQPADAVIRETKESAHQLLYQSRQTWRDNDKNPWQIVFFKRTQEGQSSQINLRLVGFPDLIEFAHPQPLTIKIRDDLIIKVPDTFDSQKEAYAPNVGQYDFMPILDHLESNNVWILELPLKEHQSNTIKIPYFILEEWQEIIAKKT